MKMRFIYLLVLFFSVYCFSQDVEENNAFYKEAVEKLKIDNSKSIKIYEYLINNSANTIQKLNYQLDLVKIKVYVSKDTEALDIFFAIEPEVLASNNQELKDRYYLIGSDLFYYLGFKEESKKLLNKVKTKDSSWINDTRNKFINLKYDLSFSPIISKKINNLNEANATIDSLQIANEVERFILLKRIQNYFLSTNSLKEYAIYTSQLNELAERLNVEKKTTQNYLVNKLIDQQKSQKEIKEKHLKRASVVLSIVFILIIITLIFYKKKKRIEENIVKTNLISDKVESEILMKLENFEKNKGFLNPTITISILAKDLDTNIKYLSSILNNVKQKSFNNYINELRIDYIVKILKEDKKFRLYKISHLAKESGFISQSSFTTFFKLVTGVTPSVFVKNLNEDE
ncbi:helix-turn-helix domain-containing protein [Empedobacter falsenii]|uniref:helix-turn-helix domain-containing protein n=2 Tax=Weeksellaceae TaxID=2762318 RepID=UPI000ED9A8EF|nr:MULTISPECIES: AraC family transcriptional regulator [Empedobacter]HAD79990.1 hypothetical protein [Flavobacteriaceae bacterium]